MAFQWKPGEILAIQSSWQSFLATWQSYGLFWNLMEKSIDIKISDENGSFGKELEGSTNSSRSLKLSQYHFGCSLASTDACEKTFCTCTFETVVVASERCRRYENLLGLA
ncbi:hypothetical protein TNCV_173161 [Trichonephila clavipes]|nr:hypothetical protein TNCV_173161 [Trichonephila clavipes]